LFYQQKAHKKLREKEKFRLRFSCHICLTLDKTIY